MDELERRIREANPHERCEVPEHAEQALNEIMQGRTAAGSVGGLFMAVLPFDRSIAAQTGEIITRAVLVCIAKEAAHQLVEPTQT